MDEKSLYRTTLCEISTVLTKPLFFYLTGKRVHFLLEVVGTNSIVQNDTELSYLAMLKLFFVKNIKELPKLLR